MRSEEGGKVFLFGWGRLAILSESPAIQARSIGNLAHILAAGVKPLIPWCPRQDSNLRRTV